ncbi:MAG: phosphatase PAP2 family protein [Candidatus Acidiferrales bacterium]
MSSRPNRAIQIVLSCLLLAAALVVGLSIKFFVIALLGDFFAYGLASASIIHFRIRPRLEDLVFVLLFAALLSVITFWSWELRTSLKVALAFIGLASLTVVGIRVIWARSEERTLLWRAYLPALLFVGSLWLAPPLLKFTEVLFPKTLDLFLYSFDCSLRIQPSFLVGLAFHKLPWLSTLSIGFYLGLPAIISLIYVESLLRKGKEALPVMLALFYLGPLGWIFYNLFPASGPGHLFPADFPLHPLSIVEAMRLSLHPVVVRSARNAIPSLHMSWVLLAWWYAKGFSRWVKAIALAFVIFTVLATLGTGEHYFIDLVVAFPFTLMIFSLFCFTLPWHNRERAIGFLAGLLGTLLWFVLLRYATPFFWFSPLVPWSLVVATVALAQTQKNRILRAANPQPRATDELAGALTAPADEEVLSVASN